MKIAITGHTKGLGQQLQLVYEQQGHTVTGFSRSNGYDLRNWSNMQTMLNQITDYDMFINVAKPDFVQTTVLYELWKLWRDQSRTIVNISSVVAIAPVLPVNLFNDPGMDIYRTAKVSLNEACRQLAFKAMQPNIVLVNPMHLYSYPITEAEQHRLTAWVNLFVSIMNQMQSNGFSLKQITF